MQMPDDFRPPAHFTPLQGLAFRLLCIATFALGMFLLVRFVLPLVEQYVSVPFADWIGSLFG
ncbi:MAG: hypothetical protein ABS35_15465 [Kaistia sp. SCN 65-12]|nr:MAG: hypothetical protein ABS35_15465 [Kaistia sp. SCN 65-12]